MTGDGARRLIIVYCQSIIDLLRTKRVGVHPGLENTHFPIKSLRVIYYNVRV